MHVTDSVELAEIMMKRKQLKLKDIVECIGTSSIYAEQVIEGYQHGEKADSYKLKIADSLDIDRKYTNVKQPM